MRRPPGDGSRLAARRAGTTSERPRLHPGRAALLAAALGVALAVAVGLGPAVSGRQDTSVAAAEPTPMITPAGSVGASADPVGDPRVPSGTPSVVGEPWLAVMAVAALGAAALVATLGYVRLTGRPDDRP